MLRVHRAIRKPDVVENVVQLFCWNLVTDVLLNKIATPCHLFDAHSRSATHMQDKLPAIRVRKEVLTKPWHEEEYAEAGPEEDRDKYFTPKDQAFQGTMVAQPHALELTIESALEARKQIACRAVLLVAQQIHSQRRNECS